MFQLMNRTLARDMHPYINRAVYAHDDELGHSPQP
jgi:hypothetical protein